MSTFLNIDFDNKTATKFLCKHIIFSIIWTLFFCILLFRLDIILLNRVGVSVSWIEGLLPIILLCVTIIVMLTQKWYYTFALMIYPLLALGWFIPKIILKKGKIYLFWNYINSLISSFINLKRTLLKILLIIFSVLLLLITSAGWVKVFSMIVFSFIFFGFLWSKIFKLLGPAKLFGEPVEKVWDKILYENNPNNKYDIVRSIILDQSDKNLPLQEQRSKQIRRLALADYALQYASKELSGFKSKRAFIVSIIFEMLFILIISIIYFYFMNYQLYLFDHVNFIVTKNINSFEFFYYTIKTISLNEIESITPNSVIAKILEISSFFIIGIFLFIILISSYVSFKKEKVQDSLNKIKQLIANQNERVNSFSIEQFGNEIKVAMNEVKNINESIQGLKNFLEKIF